LTPGFDKLQINGGASTERPQMSEVLVRIKRAVLGGRYAFSEKARLEMEEDAIGELDVAESIINAVAIYKKLRSRSSFKAMRTEYLYVIQSPNLNGLAIYSKGKLVKEAGEEIYYFLVSSKKAL
jgi:hypothetical protein